MAVAVSLKTVPSTNVTPKKNCYQSVFFSERTCHRVHAAAAAAAHRDGKASSSLRLRGALAPVEERDEMR